MKDAKAHCQQSADSCTRCEGGGEWQNGRKGHPVEAQLAFEVLPLVGARPPPALLLLASGRANPHIEDQHGSGSGSGDDQGGQSDGGGGEGVICGPEGAAREATSRLLEA